jgi:predicted RNA binding protein YcfA (HicA-like mRNA interferase family)
MAAFCEGMAKFPVDASLERVLRTLTTLGFEVVRRGNHVALSRLEADGSRTPLTLPHHRIIKGSTLRTALTQTGISREEFLRAWERS